MLVCFFCAHTRRKEKASPPKGTRERRNLLGWKALDLALPLEGGGEGRTLYYLLRPPQKGKEKRKMGIKEGGTVAPPPPSPSLKAASKSIKEEEERGRGAKRVLFLKKLDATKEACKCKWQQRRRCRRKGGELKRTHLPPSLFSGEGEGGHHMAAAWTC